MEKEKKIILLSIVIMMGCWLCFFALFLDELIKSYSLLLVSFNSEVFVYSFIGALLISGLLISLIILIWEEEKLSLKNLLYYIKEKNKEEIEEKV